MKILAVQAQKGGAGKTTIAVHMAVCAVRQGLRTALIDIDEQRSATQWNASRADDKQLDCVACEARDLPEHIATAKAGGVDLLIIDTAPHSNADGAIAAKLADFILIPCRPARFDPDPIVSTLEIAHAASTPAYVVINGAPRGRLLVAEARGVLERAGATVFDDVLHHRAAYSHAVIDGRSVHEYEPGGTAAAEIETLYHNITRLYGDTKKKRRVA